MQPYRHPTVEDVKPDIASWLEFYDYLGQTIEEVLWTNSLSHANIMESFFNKYAGYYFPKTVIFDPSKVVTLQDGNSIYNHEDVFIGVYCGDHSLTVSLKHARNTWERLGKFSYSFPSVDE
jgi:hypothetical protein